MACSARSRPWKTRKETTGSFSESSCPVHSFYPGPAAGNCGPDFFPAISVFIALISHPPHHLLK